MSEESALQVIVALEQQVGVIYGTLKAASRWGKVADTARSRDLLRKALTLTAQLNALVSSTISWD
jgi:hypothetical protein